MPGWPIFLDKCLNKMLFLACGRVRAGRGTGGGPGGSSRQPGRGPARHQERGQAGDPAVSPREGRQSGPGVSSL
jgi:hypothetical protein